MNEIKSKKKGSYTAQVCLWWLVRAFLLVGVFTAETAPKKAMVLLSLAATFAVGAVKRLFSKSEFICELSPKLQSCVCLVAFFGSGLGYGAGLFKAFPEYDVPLSLFGGIIGVAIGYYISIALRPPQTRKDWNFTVIISFCVSCAFIAPKEILQFFIDYYTGRNLLECQFVGDDHWLIKLIGPMMSMYEQRPLLDYSEDLLMAVVGAVLGTAVLYGYIIGKNKELFAFKIKSAKDIFSNIPSRCRDKFIYEVDKVRAQTNIFDVLLWWSVRIAMLYAFAVMENRAEATLLFVNFLGTVAISALHFVTPKESMFCKINYRVQTLLCIIVFLGSYVGNYIEIYYIVGRYDALLHFISGFISFAAGYYLAVTLVKTGTSRENVSVCLFAIAFSFTVIPIHEVVEFVGDYIWGTANQGFLWEPSDNILLYRFFGRGVGNELLIRIYDTMYDMSLAGITSLTSLAVLAVSLKRKRRAETVLIGTETKKETVNC